MPQSLSLAPPSPQSPPRARRWLRLTPWQRRGLALLLVAVLLFGVLVEIRSAFLQRRMGDLDVFLRTAWAVRHGLDIYAVTDHNGYHYHYPPLFAILLVPLADPPPQADRSWTLPYPVTVALWYALSVLCLAVAVHWLASALEQTTSDPAARAQPAGCRRWWGLRVLPVLACLPPIGHTLMRGQVSLLLLLLVCGTAAALLRGRSWQAGLWLAGAVCLKVIPAFLLLYPLWRRDGRCLAGCVLGLVLGLAVVPAAVFGPARAWAYYAEWTRVLLWPALGTGTDQSRAKELIEVTATDSQSFQATFHNTLYPDPATRPQQPSALVRCAHWLAGGSLTIVTLLVARRRWDDPLAVVITFGALTVIMLLLSPVCHLHYFCLALPLVMGSLAALWERNESLLWGAVIYMVLALNVVANALPHIPGLQPLRDGGLAMYAALLLWVVGNLILWKRTRPPLALAPDRPD